MSIYSDPERYGLRLLGSMLWAEPDDPAGFDFSSVWKDIRTGELYWSTTFGCRCCCEPFEDHGLGDLITGSRMDLAEWLDTTQFRRDFGDVNGPMAVVNFLDTKVDPYLSKGVEGR